MTSIALLLAILGIACLLSFHSIYTVGQMAAVSPVEKARKLFEIPLATSSTKESQLKQEEPSLLEQLKSRRMEHVLEDKQKNLQQRQSETEANLEKKQVVAPLLKTATRSSTSMIRRDATHFVVKKYNKTAVAAQASLNVNNQQTTASDMSSSNPVKNDKSAPVIETLNGKKVIRRAASKEAQRLAELGKKLITAHRYKHASNKTRTGSVRTSNAPVEPFSSNSDKNSTAMSQSAAILARRKNKTLTYSAAVLARRKNKTRTYSTPTKKTAGSSALQNSKLSAPSVIKKDSTSPIIATDDSMWPPPLHHIADEHNQILVLIVNCGYIDMADNLIGSLMKLNITNFVLVPLDDTTHDTLIQIYPSQVIPVMPGLVQITEAARFRTEAFKKLTSSRANILRKFLDQGYTTLYCDLDMVWRHNAFHHLRSEHLLNGYEVIVVFDHHQHTICSCFMYLLPTPGSKQLLDTWQYEISTGRHQQDQPAFQAALRRLKDKLHALKIHPQSVFLPSGRNYFQLWNDTMRDQVVIIHNNYINGKDGKVGRFMNWSLWHPTGNLEKVSYECTEANSRRRLQSCSLWFNETATTGHVRRRRL